MTDPPNTPRTRVGRGAVAIVLAGAVLALLGRGASRRVEPRGGPAPVDAAPAPLAGPPVTVSVFDDGSPAVGREVVFHDARGEARAQATTDAAGRATGLVGPGGAVTVVVGTSTRALVTVLGVSPGEALVVGEPEDEGGLGETLCTARVAVPPGPAGAARRTVSLGVGATEVSGADVPMAVLRRYVVDGAFFAIAEAEDARGGSLGYAHARVRACADAGDAGAAIAIRAALGPWRRDVERFEATVEGLAPASAPNANDAPDAPETTEATLALLPPGDGRFERGTRRGERGPLRATFEAPAPLGRSGELDVARVRGDARTLVRTRRRVLPADLRFGADAFLPLVVAAAVEGEGPRPTVTYALEAAPPPDADATVVRLAWPATREHVWTIVAPPDTARGRLTVPALPDALAAERPGGVAPTVAVAVVAASFVDGFADAKRRGLFAFEDPPRDADVTLRASTRGEIAFLGRRRPEEAVVGRVVVAAPAALDGAVLEHAGAGDDGVRPAAPRAGRIAILPHDEEQGRAVVGVPRAHALTVLRHEHRPARRLPALAGEQGPEALRREERHLVAGVPVPGGHERAVARPLELGGVARRDDGRGGAGRDAGHPGVRPRSPRARLVARPDGGPRAAGAAPRERDEGRRGERQRQEPRAERARRRRRRRHQKTHPASKATTHCRPKPPPLPSARGSVTSTPSCADVRTFA